ncbi:hypothetical protein HZ326_5587 [Fusarium oxysporum f. sp. albedinis]|nr:hypothetical protein HZ326_5587 [Fusarium oxysporum f. sp. albedinis]
MPPQDLSFRSQQNWPRLSWLLVRYVSQPIPIEELVLLRRSSVLPNQVSCLPAYQLTPRIIIPSPPTKISHRQLLFSPFST